MNKKVSIGATISLIAIAAAITCILTLTFSQDLFNSKVNVKERTEINKKIEEIDNYTRANFLGEINEEALLSEISDGYIKGLGDKYGEYYTTEEYQTIKRSDAGMIIGIGVSCEEDESGYILVTEVKENSPAKEVGLLVGDFIVAVNDADVLATGYTGAVASVAGDEGSTVKLTIRREGVDQQFQLVRRKMDIVTVNSRMLENSTGYIQITTFDGKTPEQFSSALEKLIADGAKALVFDVRDNSGGILDSLQGVLSNLLPAGDLATATFKNGDKKVIVHTDGSHDIVLPMAVLMNNNTASAAELFAAILRDSGKAQLIGTNSYGKGVMQYTTPLLDGSAIKLTVATYETPKTPCYDGIGLKPNFEVTFVKGEDESYMELDALTDPQLKKALEVLYTG